MKTASNQKMGIRPRVVTKNAGGWFCPFVSSDNPNYVAKTADELIDHMADHHQVAFAKAVQKRVAAQFVSQLGRKVKRKIAQAPTKRAAKKKKTAEAV